MDKFIWIGRFEFYSEVEYDYFGSRSFKTALSQKLLEKYKYPYFSIDHLKMGLIRSGNTELTPSSDDAELTEYLWKIVREMIKTAIENNQNLIVEGCYIPFDWRKDFEKEYLDCIRYYCLVMSEKYIERHFIEIKRYKNDWSLRELKRQFDSSLYECLLLSSDNEKVRKLAMEGQVISKPSDLVKGPYVLKFLGFSELAIYSETELKNKIIDNLQNFLLELGKDFTFVGRQVRFTYDEEHFFVDLVFYNRLLKCFVYQ